MTLQGDGGERHHPVVGPGVDRFDATHHMVVGVADDDRARSRLRRPDDRRGRLELLGLHLVSRHLRQAVGLLLIRTTFLSRRTQKPWPPSEAGAFAF